MFHILFLVVILLLVLVLYLVFLVYVSCVMMFFNGINGPVLNYF